MLQNAIDDIDNQIFDAVEQIVEGDEGALGFDVCVSARENSVSLAYSVELGSYSAK